MMTPRLANSLGFIACAGLLAYAYFAQFVLHLDPCPLCIFQRVGLFALGVVFLIAAAHGPQGAGRRVYAGSSRRPRSRRPASPPASCTSNTCRRAPFRPAAPRSISCCRFCR